MAFLTGFHAIEERLKAGGSCGALLMAKAGPRAREIAELARKRGVRIDRVGTHDLDRISEDHRGIALEVEDTETFGSPESIEDFIAALQNKKTAIAVVLDEITDPHNFGAIIRSCDQFGVDLIITRTKRTAKHSDIIAKASAGAVSWAPLVSVANLQRSIDLLKENGFWIYGADMSGTACYKQKLQGRVCLILGSEGDGISRMLAESCDGIIAIPSKGKVDSLNVSVAAGVLLYEIKRQQNS
ncbi:MAG: 23S rRNA (guanosine(2251)-2'-O)-methyltransferase RlmB [Spirochaetaceae bacterium]|jgi:23S rRNA (guanosine2251-2'-O)-methyltransferase|nr:23S rRNA (guanosine(2251)-2'-O)-methyltransferase RlmB [Spirochaetaceae bacterium]